MHILFTCIGTDGHFNPLVEIARSARAAGHDVAFATGAAFCSSVERAGFRAFPAGFDYAGRPLDAWFPELRVLTGDEYIRFVARDIRVKAQARRMVPDLLRLAESRFAPDVVVRDAAEYGGCIAADVLGLPHASVRTARTPSSYPRRMLVQADLSQLRTEHGLQADPGVEMPFRYLHLACEPPGFSPPDEAPAPTSHALAPAPFDAPEGDELPGWFDELPHGSTLCATLGTFMNRCVDVFTAILDELQHEPLDLILLVGRDAEPDAFGPPPDNVHVLGYLPLSLVLPRCAAVISHAGFSTLCTTLLNGLPSVLIPLGADQPENAEASARLGVARVVAPREYTPGEIRSAVRAVLAESTYRERAESIRTAMLELPGPARAVELLEQLARDKQPLASEQPRASEAAA